MLVQLVYPACVEGHKVIYIPYCLTIIYMTLSNGSQMEGMWDINEGVLHQCIQCGGRGSDFASCSQGNTTSFVLKPPIIIDTNHNKQVTLTPFPASLQPCTGHAHNIPPCASRNHTASPLDPSAHTIWTRTSPNSLDICPPYSGPYLLSLQFSTISQPAVLQEPRRDIDRYL